MDIIHIKCSNYLATLIYILCICVWGWICHCPRVKVRGQLDRVCSYLLPCGTQEFRLPSGGKCFYLLTILQNLSHLITLISSVLGPVQHINPNILQERTDKHTGQCLVNNCFRHQRINSSFEDLRQVLGEELTPEENHGEVNMSKLTLTKSSPCTSLTQMCFVFISCHSYPKTMRMKATHYVVKERETKRLSVCCSLSWGWK